MNATELIDTARALAAGGKGLLAMDESNPTCNKRLAKEGIPQTEEARRAYRGLIVTTAGLGESISGAILYDETIRQQKKDGTPFVKVIMDAGIIPGIKVDTGAKDLAGHPKEKVTKVSTDCVTASKNIFTWEARFAKWRGQPSELASARLNAMNVRFESRLPWALAFSFARAIQQPALEIWKGEEANVLAAQQALNRRPKCNRAARRGEYSAGMERMSTEAPRLKKPVGDVIE
jgi:fructose-bisphosphate aldolase class 1